MTLNEAAQILGIPVTANADELRKAFRKLAKQWHPDAHPNDKHTAEKMMKKINEAHAVFLKHLENGGNTGGTSRPGNTSGTRPNQGTNTGRPGTNGGTSRPGGNSSTSRPGTNSSTSAHDDPVVKMYWQYYQNAKRDHENLINGELATMRKKLTETEKELQTILNDSFGVDREKERKCVEKLNQLLFEHKLLVSRAKILADQKELWLKKYNEAIAIFEKKKNQGRK